MVTPAEPVLKTKMEDMGSLKAPRSVPQSKGKKAHLLEIIVQSAAREMPNVDPNKVIEAVGMKVQKEGARLIQMGNTVLMITPKGPGVIELHTSSIDSPEEIVKQWRTFLTKTAKSMGIKKVLSYSNNPAITRLVQKVGLPIKISQTPQGFRYEMDI
jgi:hypothetical protein